MVLSHTLKYDGEQEIEDAIFKLKSRRPDFNLDFRRREQLQEYYESLKSSPSNLSRGGTKTRLASQWLGVLARNWFAVGLLLIVLCSVVKLINNFL